MYECRVISCEWFLKLLWVFCFLLYAWVRASWIEFNNCSTRCDLFSSLHFCRQLYMFQVLTSIIRSWYSCNYSFWYWLTGSATIHFRCWVGTDSHVSIHMNQFQLNNGSGWYETRLINTRSCNYSCTSSWWWVSTPETYRAAYRNVIIWISRILLDNY